jgi:hypothetical protein
VFELCRNLGDGAGIDQAAAFFCFTSMPSANLTPVITFGNFSIRPVAVKYFFRCFCFQMHFVA